MSSTQAGETGGLVAATRLDTDETVLDNIDTANTVAAGDSVGSQEDVNGVGDGLLLAILGVLKLDGDTLLEVDGEVLGLVRGGQGVRRQLPHVGGGSGVRVLQDTGLVGAMGQVLIHTPGLGLGGGDGDALLSGIGKEIVTAGETLVEDGVAPRGDNLDGGLQGVESKLETNLVVTLTSAAVGNGEAALALFGKLQLDIVLYAANMTDFCLTWATSIWARAITGRASEVPVIIVSGWSFANRSEGGIAGAYRAGKRSRRRRCKQWQGSTAHQ